MLQRVLIEGVKLPRLYIAENLDDVKQAKTKGIPYVRWNLGMNELIKQMLRPTLEKMFPHIKWNQVLGTTDKTFKTKIMRVDGRIFDDEEKVDIIDKDYDNDEALAMQMEDGDGLGSVDYHEEETADIARSKREFITPENPYTYSPCSIANYVGDLSSYVNIEVLQSLNLLPKFLGDITDCIKINLSNNMRWREGYNKKRGVPIGTFGSKGYLPNLIILDVSGSIPRGISATMLTLIDTMRTQLDADLIITSDKSVYYPHGSELPTPQAMRNYFGIGNECRQFYAILEKYVKGRRWGHVISFGDYDAPAIYNDDDLELPQMSNTSIMAVHHYHTDPDRWKHSANTDVGRTGYAEWVHVVNPSVEEHKDSSWCKVIDDGEWY